MNICEITQEADSQQYRMQKKNVISVKTEGGKCACAKDKPLTQRNSHDMGRQTTRKTDHLIYINDLKVTVKQGILNGTHAWLFCFHFQERIYRY